MNSQIPILIFLVPFSAALLMPLVNRINRELCHTVAWLAMATATALAVSGWLLVERAGGPVRYALGGWAPPFGIEWSLDPLSSVMAILICSVSGIVLLATRQSVIRELGNARLSFYMSALLLISGLIGMILTHDLFNLFVFLEVSSLSAYALIAAGDPRRGTIASFRYLIIGTVGASFYLLGVGYLYAATGTLNMSDMAARLPGVITSRSVITGTLFIFIGLAVKMGLFPFHGWLPDSYTFASNPASALIAPLMTKVAIYAMIRICLWVFGIQLFTSSSLGLILRTLGTIAIFAGAILAFMQTRFKRMLAYSSIAHIGLIALAIGLNHKMALIGAVLHIINHAVMKAALFLVAASVEYRHGIYLIEDFTKLKGKMPWTSAAFLICALSMAGVPPLSGFFSKWYILLGAFQAGYPGFAVAIVASSLLSALYFFKVIEKVFLQKPVGKEGLAEAPAGLVFSTGFLSLCVFLLGLFAPVLYQWGTHHLFAGGL